MSDLERADEIMAAVIEARGDAQIARVREAIAQTLADERSKAFREGHEEATQLHVDSQNEGHW